MRTYLVAVALASLTAVAHADPEPTSYVSAGVMFGANEGAMSMSSSFEGGVRLGTSPVWLRGVVVAGQSFGFLETGSGNLEQFRGGPELRVCVIRGQVCAIGGADIGIQHAAFTETADFFGDQEMNVSNTTRTIAVPHVGFELGKHHVRYRSTVDVPFSMSSAGANDQYARGVNGFDATGSIAYVW